MTAALAMRTSSPPPLIRLRPAPDLEPPYDDEAGNRPTPLELPLEWPEEQPWRPVDRPGLYRPAVVPASEAKLAAHRYLALCLEVLGGFRPLAHLRVLTSAAAFDQIAAQLTRPRATGQTASRARTPLPAPGEGTLRPTARLVPAAGDRVTLRQLLVCEPIAGVAEVAAVLGRAGRVWAMALRLERHHGVWLCIHLEVL
jgi:hypothetical protein